MQARFDFYKASPETMKALFGAQKVIQATGLDERLIKLVELRASQINGCAFCMHMHAGDARKAGVPDEVLDTVAGWREAPWFSDRERAALAWTEALTELDRHSDLAAALTRLSAYSTDEPVCASTATIGMINLCNRIQVSNH